MLRPKKPCVWPAESRRQYQLLGRDPQRAEQLALGERLEVLADRALHGLGDQRRPALRVLPVRAGLLLDRDRERLVEAVRHQDVVVAQAVPAQAAGHRQQVAQGDLAVGLVGLGDQRAERVVGPDEVLASSPGRRPARSPTSPATSSRTGCRGWPPPHRPRRRDSRSGRRGSRASRSRFRARSRRGSPARPSRPPPGRPRASPRPRPAPGSARPPRRSPAPSARTQAAASAASTQTRRDDPPACPVTGTSVDRPAPRRRAGSALSARRSGRAPANPRHQ